MSDQSLKPDTLYDLVVIGASAGGIEALALLVATLPPDFSAPIVIAQHLDPTQPSRLGEILVRRSTLPVRVLTDEAPEPLTPGVIYVVPANRHVEITGAKVTLAANHRRGPKPSIDRLLATAARAFGERLIAVILTGSGSDGAMGARVVKSVGGTVIIENPSTASYPSMPASLAPTTVDIVADIERIGPLLRDLAAGRFAPAAPDTEDLLPALLQQVHAHTGIDFTRYKRASILRRLQRRMAAAGIASLADYLSYIEHHPEEYTYLATSFLIKVTGFFRDRPLFRYLREQVIPDIIKRAKARGQSEIRVWSAGCATGEEAYSLAILLREALGEEIEHLPARIFATDVDSTAIAFARRGIYSRAAIASLPLEYRSRYFKPVEAGFAVTEELRGLIIFGEHDLGHEAPFPQIDLALCRNVLIYFTRELQRRVLELFTFSLRDGGYLVMGQAESAVMLTEYFARTEPRLSVYRRHGERNLAPPIRPSGIAYPQLGSPATAATPRSRYLSLFPERGEKNVARTPGTAIMPPGPGQPPLPPWPETSRERLGTLLLNIPLGVVVVDSRYDIQIINRIACQLLGVYRPAIGEDLLHLVERTPVQPLRAALDAVVRAPASQRGQPRAIQIAASTGEPASVHIAFYPVLNMSATPPSGQASEVEAIFLFVSAGPALDEQRTAATTPALPQPQALTARPTSAKTTPTEIELARLRDEYNILLSQLQSIEAANQELMSANLEARRVEEELLVRQEELQADDEQIRTLNEELQATNEEVEAVNEELEATIEELHMTNDDLLTRSRELQRLTEQREALNQKSQTERALLLAALASQSDAVLVVDAQGNTIATNAAYTALFKTSESSDTPTPRLLDLEGRTLPDEQTPQGQAREQRTFQMEFLAPTADGSSRRIEANGRPVLDEAGNHIGGMVTFREVTDHDHRS